MRIDVVEAKVRLETIYNFAAEDSGTLGSALTGMSIADHASCRGHWANGNEDPFTDVRTSCVQILAAG